MADGSAFIPWTRRPNVELIMQSEAAECALACLAMVAQYHGNGIGLPALRRRFSSSLKGMALDRVIAIADELGFECRALRAEIEYLAQVKEPVILHWDLNHFVVLAEARAGSIVVMDPSRGRVVINLSEVGKHFTGILLELTPSIDFKQVESGPRIPLSALTGSVIGLKRSLLQVMALAFAIELLALCAPIQAQWTIDHLTQAGVGQIATAAAIFAVVVVVQASLTAARAWLVSWIGANVSSQWVTNIFGHMMRLPLEFFERRNLGDVLSRFSSVRSIQDTLTGSFLTVILDGLTGCLALIMLFVYSKEMTILAVCVAAVYGCARILMFKALWRANEERVVFQARQQTELIESVRGIQAIKLANCHAERRTRLANATVEATKRELVSQRIQMGFTAGSQGLFGLQRVFLLACGAYLINRGELSSGMVIATLAYADQFSSRLGSFIDKMSELRMLRLHLNRIADIVTAEQDNSCRLPTVELSEPPKIEVRSVGYRYSQAEPWIFRDLSFVIEAGQSVALVGPSGCGKTTLAKLILGLNSTLEGEINIAGLASGKPYGGVFGKGMAAVMQDDCLFSGSIADNIAFFDSSSDLSQIVHVAKLAGIHREVISMPMGYETLVGDMGSTFSGGQKQRLLLARALYQKPKVLVLDEATSHLDGDNERLVNDAVSALNITRIIVAHRKETIAMADRVFDLSSRSWIR